MKTVKMVSLILLAVFLIFNSIAELAGFHLHSLINLLLGLVAVISGILMLISVKEFLHYSEED